MTTTEPALDRPGPVTGPTADPTPATDRSTDHAIDPPAVVLVDRFPTDVAPGGITGPAVAGPDRVVTDVEGRISADNGALRIRPLAEPGWGRCGLAYGPLDRRAGRVLAVHALNGHNASQTWHHPETPRQRVRRWLGEARRLGRTRRRHHYENFAVGWFPQAAPTSPERSGNGFVMHSASGDNGELWATVGGAPMRVATGIQNLEIVYAVVLRERGATYYAASVTGAHALGAFPDFLPLAVDPRGTEPHLYPGVHQRILGEVGYRVDTRVPWVSVVDDPTRTGWHGGALVAHRFLAGAERTGADAGPSWDLHPGVGPTAVGLGRTDGGGAHGGRLDDGDQVAGQVDAGTPIGLVHTALSVTGPHDRAGVLFRLSAGTAWRCTVGTGGCELARRTDGGPWTPVALDPAHRARPGRTHHLQVTDDGTTIGAHLDGQLLFDGWTTRVGADGTGVGVVLDGTATVTDFEAHARAVHLPLAVDDPGPWAPTSGPIEIDDRFAGPAGDLAGAPPSAAGPRWQRIEGLGAIDRTGAGGARVRADVDHPNPGRTIYAVDWSDPGFADLELEMTPPGTGVGQGQECRVGVVLWQDDQNYLVANIFLDNLFDGSSISTFFRCRGHEDMHDAVWTLVRPVRFGEPCTLRVVSDGRRFLAHLGDRPSLHRSFTDVYPDAPPLAITKVGIVVNEEWGDDTGTALLRFTARRGPTGEVHRA